MEDPVVERFPKSHFRQKAERQYHSSYPLEKYGSADDQPCQADDSAHIDDIDTLFQKAALPQRDLPSQEKGETESESDKSKPADLDQDQNNDLAEKGPVQVSVRHDQPGHTGGTGRCEKGSEKIGGFSRPACQRRH